jgi:hypothetical protein
MSLKVLFIYLGSVVHVLNMILYIVIQHCCTNYLCIWLQWSKLLVLFCLAAGTFGWVGHTEPVVYFIV